MVRRDCPAVQMPGRSRSFALQPAVPASKGTAPEVRRLSIHHSAFTLHHSRLLLQPVPIIMHRQEVLHHGARNHSIEAAREHRRNYRRKKHLPSEPSPRLRNQSERCGAKPPLVQNRPTRPNHMPCMTVETANSASGGADIPVCHVCRSSPGRQECLPHQFEKRPPPP